MRALVLIALVGGCTAPSLDNVYKPDGERLEIAYIVLSPFCLLFCTTTVSSTGSRVEGSGSSNTQSTSQTVSTTGGGN